MRTSTLLILLCGIGCAAGGYYAPIDVRHAGDISLATQVEHDPYEAVTRFVSPTVPFNGGSFFLRHFARDDGTSGVTQLYVISVHYGRWHHYRSAYEPGRRKHGVTRIANDVDCFVDTYVEYCTYTEQVGISLSLEDLQRSVEGMNVKLSGSGGDLVLFVPGGLIDGFLRRIDQESSPQPEQERVTEEDDQTAVSPTNREREPCWQTAESWPYTEEWWEEIDACLAQAAGDAD